MSSLPPFSFCTMDGCSKTVYPKSLKKGLCRTHYNQQDLQKRRKPDFKSLQEETIEEKFWKKVKRQNADDCWEWQSALDKDGYGNFFFRKQKVRAHRYSYALHHHAIVAKQYVLHKCDNRKCVNPNHLFLGNAKSNYDDAKEKARNTRGSLSGLAKLDEDKVAYVLTSHSQHFKSQQQLADELGVTRQAIGYILRGATWKHVSRS